MEGRYVRHPATNDRHYVEISTTKYDGQYKWKNNAKEEWLLFSVANKCKEYLVGPHCPYFNKGFMSSRFDRKGIYGPFDEYFVYQGIS